MNRQEVLYGLNNAVILFKQQEALSLEYERVQQKDRPYEQKRKIGWIGIIVLGFEIYCFGGLIIGFLFGIVSNDTEIIKISAPFAIMALIGFLNQTSNVTALHALEIDLSSSPFIPFK